MFIIHCGDLWHHCCRPLDFFWGFQGWGHCSGGLAFSDAGQIAIFACFLQYTEFTLSRLSTFLCPKDRSLISKLWLQHYNSFMFKDQIIHNSYLFMECLKLSLLGDTDFPFGQQEMTIFSIDCWVKEVTIQCVTPSFESKLSMLWNMSLYSYLPWRNKIDVSLPV